MLCSSVYTTVTTVHDSTSPRLNAPLYYHNCLRLTHHHSAHTCRRGSEGFVLISHLATPPPHDRFSAAVRVLTKVADGAANEEKSEAKHCHITEVINRLKTRQRGHQMAQSINGVTSLSGDLTPKRAQHGPAAALAF